jgi:hypothetical protein
MLDNIYPLIMGPALAMGIVGALLAGKILRVIVAG